MKLYKTLFLRLVSHHHHPPRRPISSLVSHFSSSSTSSHHHDEMSRGFNLSHHPPRPISPLALVTARFSSSSSSSSSHLTTSRRTHHHGEEESSRGVKVSVWWDFENCHLPTGANVFKVAQSITSAVRINGIKGPITITAFGDVSQLSRTNQEALSATGINLTHVPQDGKNSTDRSLITDLMCWVAQNPPPAHLFLISSDRDFSSVLHKLRMSNYNVLLAGYQERSPGVLCSAASIMWDWNALVRGNNLAGKCFNQPPDGPYNSWYGHYKTPLLDPFAASSTTRQEACSASVVRIEELEEGGSPVPEEVVREIGLVLSLYPKGVSITELREQLKKRDVPLGEEFYGYKRFSRFLLAMPEILQVVPKGEGVFLVRACKQGMDNNKVVSVEEKPQKVKQNVEAVENESESQESYQESESQEIGLEHLQEKKQEGVVSEGKVVDDDKDLESQIAYSTSSESAKEVRVDTEVSRSQGILSRLLKRFKFFWGRSKELSDDAPVAGAIVDDVFAQDSFWKDVESFINSPRGFVVVSHSPSREALAKNLKDEGHSSLKQLDLSKTLYLVSLLISDKKWIKENPSEALPFRVTRFTSSPSNPHASSVLRSMFVNMSRSQCEEAESKNNGVSTQKPLEERTRSEVIADCHKLIKKITEENPGGYNMSLFKKDFLEEFGYRLDYQSLGYPKLQSLIQMMPEARVESGYIVPSSTLAPYASRSSVKEEVGSVSKKTTNESEPSVGDDVKKEKKEKEERDQTERDVLKILGCWDSVEDDEKACGFGKDKLVDGILTSLREKPSGGESRVL
ncbi:putative endonuclease or glycosyl hydrolase [Hirschfeldia incana]|nr:putative endonuclease or glycosyl hydrolase [Hirschfeldia incana]